MAEHAVKLRKRTEPNKSRFLGSDQLRQGLVRNAGWIQAKGAHRLTTNRVTSTGCTPSTTCTDHCPGSSGGEAASGMCVEVQSAATSISLQVSAPEGEIQRHRTVRARPPATQKFHTNGLTLGEKRKASVNLWPS